MVLHSDEIVATSHDKIFTSSYTTEKGMESSNSFLETNALFFAAVLIHYLHPGCISKKFIPRRYIPVAEHFASPKFALFYDGVLKMM